MFSHSYNPMQSQGSQGNLHAAAPFWNSYAAFSHQPHAEHYYEIRRSSLSPQPTAVPPPSPSSSSVTTPDEVSPLFSFHRPETSSPAPSAIVADIISANSTLKIPTRASAVTNGDTSCDELSTTRSDVGGDEPLSSSTDVHFPELCPLSPMYYTPVPYVQRGFGYRNNRVRGRGNRRRRTRGKITSEAKANSQRETFESPAQAVLQGTAPHRPGTTSDSDSAYTRPNQETWRVIGGGVMLGTANNTISRRKLKRLQSYTPAVGEESFNGSYDEGLESNQSADGSLEFSDLLASVKLTINRPPLPDIVERPKSTLPPSKVSPLAAFFTHAEVA